MNDSAQSVFQKLTSLEISFEIYTHEPVMTVEESRLLGLPEMPCKNLFLKDSKHRLWLIVALADTRISLKELGKKIGAPGLHFAQPELLKEHLHVDPGSVTPFGLLYDAEKQVNVILDAALFTRESVGFHPLKNDATVYLSPQNLKKFLDASGSHYIEVEFV
jgi:Ala-tRNA(Pro) deacylase